MPWPRTETDFGILVCSTGVGMSIAANKVEGVRAALAFNADEVEFTRRHNNANVLTMGARYNQPWNRLRSLWTSS